VLPGRVKIVESVASFAAVGLFAVLVVMTWS
jgi:hypothetical protein